MKAPTPSPMQMAIANHREAHERYRLTSTFRNALCEGEARCDAADEASTTAGDEMDAALQGLQGCGAESIADLGALAVHLRMILSTSQHYEGEFAPFEECFEALEFACLTLAGGSS